MSKPAEFGQTLFIFLSVLGAAWWIGSIWQATGEDKLVQACKPVEVATGAVHQLLTVVTGAPPTWTLQTQAYLLGGCYYAFSVVLPAPVLDAGQGVQL